MFDLLELSLDERGEHADAPARANRREVEPHGLVPVPTEAQNTASVSEVRDRLGPQSILLLTIDPGLHLRSLARIGGLVRRRSCSRPG